MGRVRTQYKVHITSYLSWKIPLTLRNSREQHRYRSCIPLLAIYLVAHGQYTNYENHYVSITRQYYTTESQRLSEEQQKDPQAFFRHVRARIGEEEYRSKEVLPVGSWGLMRETVEKALWDGRLNWLANESTRFVSVPSTPPNIEVPLQLLGCIWMKEMCNHLRLCTNSLDASMA